MKQQTFEELREVDWRRFEEQTSEARQGYRVACPDASDYIAQYQLIARDLSIAKSRGYSHRLVGYLNGLVVRGHNLVYARRSGFLAATISFLVGGFPARVRAAGRYVLVAAVLFVSSYVGMALTVVSSPEWAYSVMTAVQASNLESMYNPEANAIGRERAADTDFSMFGFYIMNNISIGFQLFASGLVFGLGSVFYLLFNGVYLGAATGHIINSGYPETFFSFVAGHGSFELTAFVLCGAAGLMLGHSLLAPGELRRRDALQRAAHRAVSLVLGAALMLLVAAFVEAFWSSTAGVAPLVKYFVGAALWVVVIAYLAGAGRGVQMGGES